MILLPLGLPVIATAIPKPEIILSTPTLRMVVLLANTPNPSTRPNLVLPPSTVQLVDPLALLILIVTTSWLVLLILVPSSTILDFTIVTGTNTSIVRVTTPAFLDIAITPLDAEIPPSPPSKFVLRLMRALFPPVTPLETMDLVLVSLLPSTAVMQRLVANSMIVTVLLVPVLFRIVPFAPRLPVLGEIGPPGVPVLSRVALGIKLVPDM